jgi:hypothetical protein
MMLYERRIENSMYRTMNQLKQLQRKRKVDDAAAEKEFEARRKKVRAAMGLPARECNLWSERENKVKKQTQFVMTREGVKSFGQGGYEENAHPESAENKADQSQSTHPARPKRVPGVQCKSSANGRLTVV